MAESNEPRQNLGVPTKEFRRHKYLSYQGYAFPWYTTLLWISFFVGGLIYLVRHILLQ